MSEKSEWIKFSKKKTEEEWLNILNALPVKNSKERTKIANIIWFDYFGPKSVKTRWSILDQFVSEFSESSNAVDPKRVESLLIQVGYPAGVAMVRANTPKNEERGKEVMLRRKAGEESCFYAICEQAVSDVKSLVSAGVIVNGKVKEGWPPKGSYGVIGYTGRAEVAELLQWVTDGSLRISMESLGIFIKQEVLLENLGLKTENDNVA